MIIVHQDLQLLCIQQIKVHIPQFNKNHIQIKTNKSLSVTRHSNFRHMLAKMVLKGGFIIETQESTMLKVLSNSLRK